MEKGQEKTFFERIMDESGKGLLLSNAFTLIFGLIFGWSAYPLMGIYWFQSVVIGWYNFRRMRLLKRFDPGGLKYNDKPVRETEEDKKSMANFFAFHYGFFHLAYLIFLLSKQAGLGLWDYIGIAVCAYSFIANHRASFLEKTELDLTRRPNICHMFSFPYLRVIPMHIAIIAASESGATPGWGMSLFVMLKTASDLTMHAIERQKNTRE